MTAVGLILGIVGAIVAGRKALGTGTVQRVEVGLATVTLGLGIGSLIAEGGALLAPFMIALLLLWSVVMLDHAGAFTPRRTHR